MSLEVIRQATVGVVLRQLARGVAPTRTPLDELELVRRALVAAGFEPTPRARRHELARVLVELVEEELQHLRRLAGAGLSGVCESHATGGYQTEPRAQGRRQTPTYARRAPRASATLEAETLLPPAAYMSSPSLLRARILDDFGQGHAALEAQSAIYHLYVRSDLGLSLDTFVTLLGDRHRRTVQRRLSRGVAMVAERLLERERAALRETRREQLAARLPRARGSLVGIADAVEALAEALGDQTSILLAGEAGAGKSALARAAVSRLLERDRLEDLVWLEADGPIEAATIVAEVRHQLRRAEAGDARGVLLVIDGLDRPSAARAAATAVGGLGLTHLLVGRAVSGALRHGEARWMTPPALGPRASRSLLRQEMTRRGLLNEEHDWAPVVAATAGHPRALRRAAAAMRGTGAAEVARFFVEGQGPAGALYTRMWATAWREAPGAARESVRAVLALRRGGIVAHAANVARLRGLPTAAVGVGLDAALDAGLLVAEQDGRLRPARFLRRWLAVMDEDRVAAPSSSGDEPFAGPRIKVQGREARSAAGSVGSRP